MTMTTKYVLQHQSMEEWYVLAVGAVTDNFDDAMTFHSESGALVFIEDHKELHQHLPAYVPVRIEDNKFCVARDVLRTLSLATLRGKLRNANYSISLIEEELNRRERESA